MPAGLDIRRRASEFGRGFRAGIGIAARGLIAFVIVGLIAGAIVIGAIGAAMVLIFAAVVMALVFVVIFAVAITRGKE